MTLKGNIYHGGRISERKSPCPRLDLCPVEHVAVFGDLSSMFGVMWRFLPLADPTVDVLVSRDLDSR